MPWMLQPKSYTQIARPNLYNVAYRRVGAYKGMGRLNPANYLQIGVRPNQIGATTGQYNTLSGQLSLLPPSLRGIGRLGQTEVPPGYMETQTGIVPVTGGQCPGTFGCPGYIDPYQNLSNQMQNVLSGQSTIIPTSVLNQLQRASVTQTPSQTNLVPWIVAGIAVLFLSR